MTQVALRSESEFAAGVACRPCRTVGHHFCQAHDYDEQDQPACKTCLTGELCGPMRARNPVPEFDGPDLAPVPPPAAKPDPLRGEKLAETMDQRAAKPGACEYCGKPRHRGTCAERRAALKKAGIAVPPPPGPGEPAVLEKNDAAVLKALEGRATLVREEAPAERDICPACTEAMKRNPGWIALCPGTGICLRPMPAQPVLDEIPDLPAGYTPVGKSLGLPIFEVVQRSQVQLRMRSDRYAELAERLRALGPGDLLKISLPSEAAADNYAKNFSRALRKYKLRVKYQRHGDVIFLEVKPPVPPTSEVPAS